MLDRKTLNSYADEVTALTEKIGGTWREVEAGPPGHAIAMARKDDDDVQTTIVMMDFNNYKSLSVELSCFRRPDQSSDTYWSSKKRLPIDADAATVSATIAELRTALKPAQPTIQYPNADAKRLPVLPHGSKEWQLARARTIGASEVASVMGRSKYRGLIGVVQGKRDLLAGIVEENDTQVLYEGRMAEEFILKMAAARLGVTIHAAEGIVDGACSATPDGLILDGIKAEATVEAKLERSGADWTVTNFSELPAGDIRGMYYLQLQAQLAVSGCAYGYLAVWTTYELHVIRIERDEEVIAAIRQACQDAIDWVLHPEAAWPEPAAADSPFSVARTIVPASEEAMTVDGEVAEAMAEYIRLGEEADTIEALRCEAKKKVIRAHAMSANLVTTDGIKSKFTGPSKRSSIDSKMLKAMYPEVAAVVTKESTTEGTCTIRRGKGSAN